MSKDRAVDTLIHYKDLSGRERRKTTNQFGPKTQPINVEKWVASWWKDRGAFYIEIKDQHGTFVDFDAQHNKEYKPFSRCRSATSTTALVELRIVQIGDDNPIPATNVSLEPRIKQFLTTKQQQHQGPSKLIIDQYSSEVGQGIRPDRFSLLSASDSIRINEDKPGMKFTTNVNDIQRDQYVTDKNNAGANKKPGCFVKIQGDKKHLEGNAKHATLVPKIKIDESIIPKSVRANCWLLIFLVYEICEKGKRKLFHHDERHFVTDDKNKLDQSTSSINGTEDEGNVGQAPIILRLTDKMFSEHGENLDLKLTVILHTKTQRKGTRSLFCELKNEYPNNTTYETTRLACLLVQDDEILWDYLILSNAMIFPKSINDIGDAEIKDGNGKLIENIPVILLKRKINSLQPEKMNKRPPGAKKKQQNMADTQVLNSEVTQHQQGSIIHVSSEQQTQFSMPTTEPLQQGSYMLDPQYCPMRPMLPTTAGLLDPQVASNFTMPSYSEVSEGTGYNNTCSYQQSKTFLQPTTILPSIGSLLRQSFTDVLSTNNLSSDLINDNEIFDPTGQYGDNMY